MKKGRKNPRRPTSKRTPTKKSSTRRASTSSHERSRTLGQRPIPLTFSQSITSIPKMTLIRISDEKNKVRPSKLSDDSSSSEDDMIPSSPSVLCSQCAMKLGTERGLAELEQKRLGLKSGFGISSSNGSTSSSSSSEHIRTGARKTKSCPQTPSNKLCRACDEGWYSDTTTHRHSDEDFPSFSRIFSSNPLRTDSSSLYAASTSRSIRAPPVPPKTFGPSRSLPGRTYRCDLPRCSSCRFGRFDEDNEDDEDEDFEEF